MNDSRTSPANHGEPGYYEIRLTGRLDDRWTGWFDGLTITLEDSGDTLLTGPVVDQAAQLTWLSLRQVRACSGSCLIATQT